MNTGSIHSFVAKQGVTAYGADLDSLKAESQKYVDRLRPLVDEYIFGYSDDDIEVELGRTLSKRNISLSVAESCTGGFLCHLITTVPGSSAYFRGGIVAYDNTIKVRDLNVNAETLKIHGAVSEETVRDMAEQVRKKLNTDIGVATSGIAGPGGGTEEKPVGMVWIAYADEKKTVARKLLLSKDRAVNIRTSSIATLNLIRLNLPKENE